MRKLLIVLLATLVATGAVTPLAAADNAAAAQAESDCEYPLTLTDATGEEITLEEPPERIVTLGASDAQTAFEIGAGDAVVGMPLTAPTEDLQTGERTDVTAADGFEIDTEAVVELEPDVVLAANIIDTDTVDQLRELGLTVYYFPEAESIDDIRDNVAVTGQLTGECAGAQETVDWMDQRLDLLESAVDDDDRSLAYYPMGGGYTAGTGTFQHEIMLTAGLENVAATAEIDGWGIISEEVVVEEDPEWIVYGDSFDEPQVSEAVHETTAYQEENFAAVDNNDFSQPGPNVVFAAEQLLETAHPEAYESISDDLAELDSEYEDTDSTTDGADEGGEENESENGSDEEGTESDENDALPGFGVPVAAAAVLATLGLLARRR
ncbi:PGF-CTERM-anchored ABC transporter substrate-binding protein [Natribaculum luteum]|uniref:PGF-CTERM-anchored ABC transporter substrate-binding protein n=1 Tax=Natribaculum luteum TaxID=1586232 RepID=A0ABD5NWZ3_9EURY|nr:PGF-CTERM-anchored ABC transporter substrate-binding protein [Natribaculum luteum]